MEFTIEEADSGGAVHPIEFCPHVMAILQNDEEVSLIMSKLPGLVQTSPAPCQECGLNTENWLCLTTGATLCSRYQNRHSIMHYEKHKQEFEQSKVGPEVQKCCVYLSFSDLSVWCHACESYIKNPRLLPILVHAEAAKFGTPPKLHLLDSSPPSSSSPSSSSSFSASALNKIQEDDEEDDAGF